MRNFFWYFWCFLLLLSCKESAEPDHPESDLCSQIAEDSIISMQGVLAIDSQGEFLFKTNHPSAAEIGSAIYAIPCTEDLKIYVASAYDSYLHLRRMDEQFWVEIQGSYVDSDTTEKFQFLFNFVALLDGVDTLVDHYETEIQKYYRQHNSESNVELELSGSIAYEDEAVLILAFDETLKFGSWHRTNSSLFFLKDEGGLIPVPATLQDRVVLLTDYYEVDLNFPNRVQGVFYQAVDLTGDDRPEYIFHSEASVKTNLEEHYTVYRLNEDLPRLEMTNLSVYSYGTQGECDAVFGDLRKLIVHESDSAMAFIEVSEESSSCVNGQKEVRRESATLYIWDDQKNEFIELKD